MSRTQKAQATHRTPIALEGGYWMRAARYEIIAGRIRPMAGARLTRYPLRWDLNTKEPRAYELLARAIDGPESAILQWCEQFGLLGVLLQSVESVVFRPAPAIDLASFRRRRAGLAAQSKPARGDGIVTVAQLQRTGKGWQLSRTDMSPTSVPPVGVVLHGIADTHMRLEPLTGTWSQFFPSVPHVEVETYPYPHPDEEAFWRLYEEPIDEFVKAAKHLATALGTIARAESDVGSHWTIEQRRERHAALRIGISSSDIGEVVRRHHTVERAEVVERTDFAPLSDYHLAVLSVGGCTNAIRLYPSVNHTDGRVVVQWQAPTLLSSLALTLLQDLSGGRVPRHCARCSRVFTTSSWQGLYCSKTCKSYVNKQTQRRNQRIARRKRHAGKRGN